MFITIASPTLGENGNTIILFWWFVKRASYVSGKNIGSCSSWCNKCMPPIIIPNKDERFRAV